MAAKLFRCTNGNCVDAQGAPCLFAHVETPDNLDPTCPKCGTKANDPKHGRIIVRMTAIHFDAPSHVATHGVGFRACDPTKRIQVGGGIIPGLEAPNPFHGGTGDPDAVNCPECRQTEAWKTAFASAHAEKDDDGQALKAALGRLQMFRS
jgi:hypothetical protein